MFSLDLDLFANTFGCLQIYKDLFDFITRGTPTLHLNEPKRIFDGSNELIEDFLSHLVFFLDSIHPRL